MWADATGLKSALAARATAVIQRNDFMLASLFHRSLRRRGGSLIGVDADSPADMPQSPALRARREPRRRDADPRIDGNTTLVERDDRIQVELGDLGDGRGELSEAQQELGHGRGAGRVRASKAREEAARLAGRDEVGRVDVGERRQAVRRLRDELRERPSDPEADERAEGRILDHAGEHLDAAGDVRLYEDRQPDPLDRLADGGRVSQVELDTAGLGLVHARAGGLDDGRIAELLGSADRVLDRFAGRFRHDGYPVRAEEAARLHRLEPSLDPVHERARSRSVDVELRNASVRLS